MNELQQKQLAFFEETIKFYSQDTSRRAMDSMGTCVYIDPRTGNKCAIGRWLDNTTSSLSILDNHSVDMLYNANELSPKLHELGRKFLVEIQELHDIESHWDENGLSVYGLMKVERFRKRIEENYYAAKV
jgi:hypothetical protein